MSYSEELLCGAVDSLRLGTGPDSFVIIYDATELNYAKEDLALVGGNIGRRS